MSTKQHGYALSSMPATPRTAVGAMAREIGGGEIGGRGMDGGRMGGGPNCGGPNCGGPNCGGHGPFDLWAVYQVLHNWPAAHRGRAQAMAFEKAADRVLSRIHRTGSRSVVLPSMRDVYAYAKSIRSSVVKDIARHLKVEREYMQTVACHGGCRSDHQDIYGAKPAAKSEAAVDSETAGMLQWLGVRLGADAADLLCRVHVEGFSVAELSRQSGVAEGTIRSRLARAEAEARALYAREEGMRPLAPRTGDRCRDRCEVLLHNDDVSEFSTVLEALQLHAQLDFDSAEITTMAVHYEGRAVVCRVDYARAQGIVAGLSAAGLRASISYN
jgi:ATP-dependent Clp protease adapter protein ClpS/DNA-directed RNA polymerase specialized sigma24 family protein